MDGNAMKRGREPAVRTSGRGRRPGAGGTVRRRLSAVLTALFAMLAPGVAIPGGASADPSLTLGDADTYAVLAGTSVTNTNLTSITGDLGVSPGTTVTGFPPGTVSGSIRTGAAAAGAKADVVAAYNAITAMSPNATIPPALGGTTRTPGVYDSTTGPFTVNGTLTLDAQADPDAVFVFRGTTLTAGGVSNIALVNGAQEDNVYWQLSGTASLGTFCTFRGNVLASGAVSVSSGAAVYGRLFSLNNTIGLQGTTSPPATRVTVPNNPPTTTSLTSSLNPSDTGDAVTFTANVQAQSGSIVPAGYVAFKDGTTVIGTDYHDDGHPARLTTSSLSAGQHRITAVYLGGDTFDGEAVIHFAPSTSPELVQSVSSVSLWSDSVTPDQASRNDPQAVVLGVKFQAAVDGVVTGIKFYKGSQNTGTHTGSLWTSDGQKLATVTFTNETATGWQRMDFPNPVAISSGTTYIASYHTTSGFYAMNRPYFASAYTNGPLTAPSDGASGGNGVFTYSASDTFPTSSYRASNYWVDVMFTPSQTLWDNTTTPAVVNQPDDQDAVLGVKFTSATGGMVTGVRFYKGPLNTGTHIGSLWTSGGTQLATATFTNETASGWQQVDFPDPVPVTAGTTYVASYHTSGRYSVTRPYFTSPRTNGPLTAPADGASGGNGVYAYSASDTFPSSTFRSSNYWVDVVFQQS
ncbi:DUF4082 domain-containing protein [Microbispora triticiradicis]|uniref:DUF4082 domain-containing protein n=2 Tax=Microbispora triticiradicis TaxID=2200763 RepID=A0ABX9L8V4_9ACTN|nr:DUF4082 domain-containing protein [Microbispora triticiradicis]